MYHNQPYSSAGHATQVTHLAQYNCGATFGHQAPQAQRLILNNNDLLYSSRVRNQDTIRFTMLDILAFPTEIFDLIIEQLVITIGIYKTVALRAVNKRFDSSIVGAICISQVVDIDDAATSRLARNMSTALRCKVIANKTSCLQEASKPYVLVVAKVNSALDAMLGDTDPEAIKLRHITVAAAVKVQCTRFDVDSDAQNLLCAAAATGSLRALKLLLEGTEHEQYQRGINDSSPYFEAPIVSAAAGGHLDAAQYFISRGARLNCLSSDRFDPEHSVKTLNDWGAVEDDQKLIDRCVTLVCSFQSALQAAIQCGSVNMVQLFLQPEYRLPLNSLEYLRAIMVATRTGRLDMVHMLFHVIGKGMSDFPKLGEEMLTAAVRSRNQELVQWILDQGIAINTSAVMAPGADRFPLQLAASLGDISMVQFLIAQGARVDFEGTHFEGLTGDIELPIEAASRTGQEEVVKLLLSHGADPAKALPCAAGGGHLRLVTYLLDKFPDLAVRDDEKAGREAFRNAIYCGNLPILTKLVESGVPATEAYAITRRPIYETRKNLGPWIVDHLMSLGVRNLDREVFPGKGEYEARGVVISQRTWQWVSRY